MSMHRFAHGWMLLCLMTLWTALARAGTVEVPAPLQPWVPWVLKAHPTLPCASISSVPTCVWPGVFDLSVDDAGGRWTLDVSTDREITFGLPGGEGAWPQDVRVDGRPAAVSDIGGVPNLTLPAGTARVSGTYAWPVMPQGLRLPGDVARVSLKVEGVPVLWPRIEADGTLRLGAGDQRRPDEDRLDIDVARKISDGVPVTVETQIHLRASGSGREVDLGAIGLAGSHPVAIRADLPARFSAAGALVVQVRPGSYTVAFTSRVEGPVVDLQAPSPGGPWPQTEFWAVQTDDTVRAVTLSGPPAVDPARTTLPDAWRSLSSFAVTAGQSLHFEELRRGEPEPPPNQLVLSRELWLDLDGGGWTLRDRLNGTLYQGWRLDLGAPASLGHVSDHGQDQVITQGAEGAGVELRAADLQLVAESRIDGETRSLPAVGWKTDVQSLSAAVHLPPGWTLWVAEGADRVDGALLDAWTLLDLFFVLVVSVATGRLFGPKWGVVALFGLALARQESGAPASIWVALIVVVALLRALPEGRVATLARWARVAGVIVLFLILVPFSMNQVRGGLFPALSRSWQQASSLTGEQTFAAALSEGSGRSEYDSSSADVLGALSRGADAEKGWNRKEAYLSLQQDPTAVVQTGPGVPTWDWNRVNLTWTGPVESSHALRLWLVGPLGNLVLALLRVGLLAALGIRLAELRMPRPRVPGALGAFVLLLLPGIGHAEDLPSMDLLRDLESRLVEPPSCGQSCASVSTENLAVQSGNLVVRASVHTQIRAAWPVPGPAASWVPASVSVDGKPTVAMARLPDGFLYVRLEPGVHEVVASGPLPETDALTLQFGMVPHRVTWTDSTGWTIDGLRANGTVERAVQLSRTVGAGEETATSSENLAPWLEVRRDLDLGIPWRVRTTVARIGPIDRPLSLRVPLLPGEAVTDEGFQVQDAAVLATLDRDQAETSWLSTLSEAPTVTLSAPEGVPWTEVWRVSCSPIFSCRADGPAPVAHTLNDEAGVRWAPQWRPWPGESVALAVARPDGVAGQTLTLDRVDLTWKPGRRLSEAGLIFTARTSQGGQQAVRLPANAQLQSVKINEEIRPLQLRDGVVSIPLQPGSQVVCINWQQPNDQGALSWIRAEAPEVDLGSPSVNLSIQAALSEPRWELWLSGPPWGPRPLLWSTVLVLLGLGVLLARLPWAPLRARQWVLLGLGMTQISPVEAAIVGAWFFAIGYRAERPAKDWVRFNLGQLVLLGLTGLAFGMLWHAVYTGLLLPPDMQIAGNGSTADALSWYTDRAPGPLPRPVLWSLPLWAWRAVMLAWSLWLALSLVRWAPWGWRSFARGGLWIWPPKRGAVAAPVGEPVQAEPVGEVDPPTEQA